MSILTQNQQTVRLSNTQKLRKLIAIYLYYQTKENTAMSNTFKETYFVKLNYQKDDGYWVTGHIVEIDIDVIHGQNEKNNHDRAKKAALEQFPKARIVSVQYC
jgi:hypothetical protein